MSHAPVRSPPPAPTLRFTSLAGLAHRAEKAIHDVTAAHHAFMSSRTTQQHGALSLAVTHAQRVLKTLETVREQRERQRQQQKLPSISPIFPSSSVSVSFPATESLAEQQHPQLTEALTPSTEELSLYLRIDKVRIDLRRVLPRAVAAMEDRDSVDGGDVNSSRSAASTASALRSLLHTRSMLSTELQKMDTVVQGLAGTGESLAALHQSLQDVHSSMATAQVMVRKLLTVQSRDDLLLRISAMLFALVVLYVVAQRVFRLFPATVYVTVGDDA